MHGIISAGYMIKGQLTVVLEDETTMTIRKGDTIIEVVNKWHHGINNGDSDAEFIVFYAGGTDIPLSVTRDISRNDHYVVY